MSQRNRAIAEIQFEYIANGWTGKVREEKLEES